MMRRVPGGSFQLCFLLGNHDPVRCDYSPPESYYICCDNGTGDYGMHIGGDGPCGTFYYRIDQID